MRDSQIVAYGNSLSQKSFELYQKCAIIALPRKYGVSQMGHVVPKNSSLTSAFTYFTNHFIESGSVARIKHLYKTNEQNCPSYMGKPLGLEKCFSLFGMILIVAGLSFICFL